jgi:hypothetical protein
MLNLFKVNEKKIKSKKTEKKKSTKYFPSSTREWNNSIYTFNNNSLKLIPIAGKISIKLIKNFFDFYNNRLEQKIRKKRMLLRLRRLSSHKIYISNGEFKHTNNKLIITLYIFNRQNHNYKLKIKKQYYKIFKHLKNRLNRKFSVIRHRGFQKLIRINNNYLTKISNTYKNLSMKNFFILKFYRKLSKQCLSKLKMYILYKQLLFVNRCKYNNIYLQYLKVYLEKIYHKNVEFNLINLKRFYMSSDILSESINLKLTRNRRKILKYINNLRKKVKIKKKNWLLRYYIRNNLNRKNIKYNIIKNIKYKYVTGFRLEAKGRLTRRYTASRSVHKLRYKGNLMNMDSSFRGLSSVILKGNLRSNVQYTKLKSKTRIGSFGIKGWVSSD